MEIKYPVGPSALNRRPDVAKVEAFLDRTGQLDLIATNGPTGYYGSRVDQGIRRFQKDNALKVDGLINPKGPTIQRLVSILLKPAEAGGPKAGPAWRSRFGDTPGLQRASVFDRTSAPPSGSPLADQRARGLRLPTPRFGGGRSAMPM